MRGTTPQREEEAPEPQAGAINSSDKLHRSPWKHGGDLDERTTSESPSPILWPGKAPKGPEARYLRVELMLDDDIPHGRSPNPLVLTEGSSIQPSHGRWIVFGCYCVPASSFTTYGL